MDRILQLFISLIFIIKTILSSDLLESEYIKEITSKNAIKFLKDNEYVLLEFYTQDCPHCEEFSPIFLEAAKQMKFMSNLNHVKIAKIDGQKHEEITNEYDVKGFPLLKLISLKHGFNVDYLGERKSENIVKFVENRIHKKIVQIDTIQDLHSLETNKKLMLVVCGNNETYPKIFQLGISMMMKHEDLEFFHTSNNEVMMNLNCTNDKPGLLLLKNYDERRLKYDQKTFNQSNFEEWVNIFSLPTLGKLTDESIEYSLLHLIPSVILITEDETSAESVFLNEIVKSRAIKYRRQVIFMTSSNETEVVLKLLDYYNIDKLPTLVGLSSDQDTNSFHKYKFNYPIINEGNLDTWIADLVSNKLEIYYQSDPIPNNPKEDDVTVVVGKTFYDIVINNTNDVFLELYAPWCGHCTKIAPRVRRLAQKLTNNPNLVIAKIDANSNEIKGIDFQAFPSFFLFKGNLSGNEKLENKIKYTGLKNVTMMINFLRNNSYHEIKNIITLPNEDIIEEEERIEEEVERFEQEEESNFNKSPEVSTDPEDDMNYDVDKHIMDSAQNKNIDGNLEDFGGMFGEYGDELKESSEKIDADNFNLDNQDEDNVNSYVEVKKETQSHKDDL